VDPLPGTLYQAPRSFSYSWTLNGAPITGATSTTITAAVPGHYVCVETADNAAGSTSQTSVAATISSLPIKLASTKITKTAVSSKHRQAKFSFKAIGTATGFQSALVNSLPWSSRGPTIGQQQHSPRAARPRATAPSSPAAIRSTCAR